MATILTKNGQALYNTTSGKGYKLGTGQTKTVTPSDVQQTITADSGHILESVVVEAGSSGIGSTFTLTVNGSSFNYIGIYYVGENQPTRIYEGGVYQNVVAIDTTGSVQGTYSDIVGLAYIQPIDNFYIHSASISSITFNGMCCFTGDTKVLMYDNSYKDIIDIKENDEVLTYNEETHILEKCKVAKFITHENTTDMARITLVNGTSIEFNAYHPFYTQDGWKSLTGYNNMPILTQNDTLLNKDNEFIKIDKIERYTLECPITTYNLRINDNNNYFVGDEKGEFVLVHNTIC